MHVILTCFRQKPGTQATNVRYTIVHIVYNGFLAQFTTIRQAVQKGEILAIRQMGNAV